MTTTCQLAPAVQWLDAFPCQGEWFEISPTRAFAHPEGEYDDRYGGDLVDFRVGQGAASLLKARGCDTSGPALEIGCGTGRLTLGLIQSAMFPAVVITDPSPAFLSITRRKLDAQALHDPATCYYAALSGEELERLPAGSCSLIVLRSVLHHVIDVDAFVGAAARALRPGGMLLCEEPCGEGFLLMGVVAQFIPMVMAQAGRPLTPEQQKQLAFFQDCLRFYLRRDVDKSAAEDKHLFRADELMRVGARHGLTTEFLANFNFGHFLTHSPDRPVPFDPYKYMKDYLQYCMNFGLELVEAFDAAMTPHMQFIRDCSAGWSGPHFHGVYLWQRPRRS